jgi:hypothetical protein
MVFSPIAFTGSVAAAARPPLEERVSTLELAIVKSSLRP